MGGAQPANDAVGGFGFRCGDDAARCNDRSSRGGDWSSRTSNTLTRPSALPFSAITGTRSMPVFALSSSSSGTVVSGCAATTCFRGTITSATLTVRKSTTLWIIARSDEVSAPWRSLSTASCFKSSRAAKRRGGASVAPKKDLAEARAKFEHRPKDARSEDEQTGEGGESAVRKAAKERLRQHAEQEKINGACDKERDRDNRLCLTIPRAAW